jgi:hypothetical protein
MRANCLAHFIFLNLNSRIKFVALEWPRLAEKYNIKMSLTEVKLEGRDWIILVQGRKKWRVLVNTVMNLRVSKNAGNLLTS